jgi:DNA-binding transcriptional regulator PaaX
MIGNIPLEVMQQRLLRELATRRHYALVQDLIRVQPDYWYYRDTREALESLRAQGLVDRRSVGKQKMKAYRLSDKARADMVGR